MMWPYKIQRYTVCNITQYDTIFFKTKQKIKTRRVNDK